MKLYILKRVVDKTCIYSSRNERSSHRHKTSISPVIQDELYGDDMPTSSSYIVTLQKDRHSVTVIGIAFGGEINHVIFALKRLE